VQPYTAAGSGKSTHQQKATRESESVQAEATTQKRDRLCHGMMHAASLATGIR